MTAAADLVAWIVSQPNVTSPAFTVALESAIANAMRAERSEGAAEERRRVAADLHVAALMLETDAATFDRKVFAATDGAVASAYGLGAERFRHHAEKVRATATATATNNSAELNSEAKPTD